MQECIIFDHNIENNNLFNLIVERFVSDHVANILSEANKTGENRKIILISE